jgi:hypothetical protein
VVVVLLALLAALVPQPAGADTQTIHGKASGVAEVLLSTCPWDAPPAPDTVCTDLVVQLFQESIAPDQPTHRQPWILRAHETTSRYNAATDDFTLLQERLGLLNNPVADIDIVHLRRASFHDQIPMSDGSTLDVDLTIDEPGPLFVAGTDGPSQEGGLTWGQHIVGACSTENWLAHQTFRWDGILAGTISGYDLDSVHLAPHEPFIGRGVFTVTLAEHGNC